MFPVFLVYVGISYADSKISIGGLRPTLGAAVNTLRKYQADKSFWGDYAVIHRFDGFGSEPVEVHYERRTENPYI